MSIVEAMQRLFSGGVYIIPIFLVGVAMFTLMLNRSIVLWQSFRQIDLALSLEPGRLPPYGWLHALWAEYSRSRTGIAERDADTRDKLSLRFLNSFKAGGGAILLCSGLATLLGLLGTVSGMINSFEAMQNVGIGTTKSMAAGVAEALITTQSGLLIGVVGVAVGNLLNRLNVRLHNKILACCRHFEKDLNNIPQKQDDHDS